MENASTGTARWMGVGRSSLPDGHSAAAEATRRALAGPDPQLLIVFAAVGYDPTALLAGVAEVAPGVPLVGCSTSGEIAPDGPADNSVVVTAIGGTGLWVATAADEGIAGRQREAGAAVAVAADGVPDKPNKVLMVLTDGFARSQEDVLRGIYSVVGAGIPLVGGGSSGVDGRTFQLHGNEVLTNGVVTAAVASDGPLGIGVSHGFRNVGEAMVVTRSDQARVYTLNREPALDKYLQTLGAPPEVYHDPVAFSSWTLTRPLGVQRRSGVAAKNISQDVDFDGRTIGGGTEIVQGALLWATEGDSASILDAADTACAEAVAALGDQPPVGLLTFSCMGCRAVLGDDGIAQESVRIAGRAKGAPFAGFYTMGEIARTRGVEGFHNQTLVVLALG